MGRCLSHGTEARSSLVSAQQYSERRASHGYVGVGWVYETWTQPTPR